MSIEAMQAALEELSYVINSSVNEKFQLEPRCFYKTLAILKQAIQEAEKQRFEKAAEAALENYMWKRREWIGLTKDEISSLSAECFYDDRYVARAIDFAKGIEAKLREKNHD